MRLIMAGAMIMTLLLFSCAQTGSMRQTPAAGKTGVLVMAHGGSKEWNAAVKEAVAPLRDEFPISLAFGMAARDSLQKSVNELEEQGVTRIAVVRMFVSGESFLEQTEYLLRLRKEPPEPYPSLHQSGDSTQSIPPPIDVNAEVILSKEGFKKSDRMGRIIAQRVGELSKSPAHESVLVLAHGSGNDAENQRWKADIEEIVVDKVASIGNFRAVRIETLREDWPEKRKVAERRIHEFVTTGNEGNGRVIIIPFRLYGFGPYEEVLEGLDYVSNGQGLLPHPEVTNWIREQMLDCFQRRGRTLTVR